jgi:hypothetical protein
VTFLEERIASIVSVEKQAKIDTSSTQAGFFIGLRKDLTEWGDMFLLNVAGPTSHYTMFEPK